MTLLWLCLGWVFAAVGVAMLPLRRQYLPGLALLLLAPVLIGAVALQVGWVYALLALAAVVSMFRNPLRYLWARLRSQPTGQPR